MKGWELTFVYKKTDICLLQVFAVGPHVSALPAGPAHSSNLHAFDTVQKTTVFIDTQYRLIESVAMTNQSSYLPRGKPIFTVHLWVLVAQFRLMIFVENILHQTWDSRIIWACEPFGDCLEISVWRLIARGVQISYAPTNMLSNMWYWICSCSFADGDEPMYHGIHLPLVAARWWPLIENAWKSGLYFSARLVASAVFWSLLDRKSR